MTEASTTPVVDDPDPEAVAMPPFLVLPIIETPAQLRRSPGVVAVIVTSLALVGLGGAWPAVTRALEGTSESFGDGELWRVATYVFPHERGWWHVAANMAVLALFGWQLERVLGTARFLGVYLGSGAVGMALLFAANSIDAERGLRGGASLAIFGVVAALATAHAVTGGLRGRAMAWAIPTCAVLLTAGGLLAIGGRGGVIDPGLDGFRFGFFNHAFGMVAGVLLGLTVFPQCTRRMRLLAATVAIVALGAGLWVGITRWT